MKALLFVIALMCTAQATAAEWPVLQKWEYTLRFDPPTKKDFAVLAVIGPKWDAAVARYNQTPVTYVEDTPYVGTRAEIWTGIDALHQIAIPPDAFKAASFDKILDYAKLVDPQFKVMSDAQVYRYVLIGQALNADKFAGRSPGDLQFCLFNIFGCGVPPTFPPPEPPALPDKFQFKD